MSLYKDASLVMIPSAVKDGKLYSIRPTPEYGAEEITNGSFDSDSNWTKGSGWTISGGKANASSATSDFTQTISYTLGKTYRITYTISNYSSGSVRTLLGAYISGATRSSNGTFIEDITPTNSSSNSLFYLEGISGFSGSIDNVSVQEITKSGDFTFSRGSNLAATRVDVNGLIEKGRENLALYSQDFSQAAWIKTNLSLTSNQTDPFGETNAFLVTSTSAVDNLFVQAISNQNKVCSIYAKAGNRSNFAIVNNAYGNGATFDLSAETAISSGQGSLAVIESVGNDWYRCSVYFSLGAQFLMVLADVNGNGYSNGDTMSFFGAQMESSLVATDYIETGASTAQAGILEDLPRLDYSASCPSLLLEPQRTNGVLQSEYFGDSYWLKANASVVDNAVVSPEGVQNAAKLVEDSSNGIHYIRTGFLTSTDGSTLTTSLFVKAAERTKIRLQEDAYNSHLVTADLVAQSVSTTGIDAGIEPLEDGWFRIYIIDDARPSSRWQIRLVKDDSSSYQGDGTSGMYIYGFQFENQASYPTSYIPTYGSAVTRSEDESETSAISGLVGANSGSLFLEISYLEFNSYSRLSLSDGTSNNTIYSRTQPTTNGGKIQFLGGNLLLQTPNDFASLNTFYKVAIGFEENNAVLYIDGVQIDTDTSFTMPSGLDTFAFGQNDAAINPVKAEIKQALLFKTRLTNAELAALTA